MRCPKCGYISFDHHTSCSKCSRDLTEIAEELQGTSLETDLSLFLGSVTGTLPDDNSFEDDAATFMTADDDADLELDDSEDDSPGISMKEPPTVAIKMPQMEPEEEISIDMDEIPPIDLSGLESTEEEETEPADQTESLLAEAKEFNEDQEEVTTVNLDEIDLSDLAPLDESPSEETTLDLSEETPVMDLNMEDADDGAETELETEDDTDQTLDLSLDSEAEEELSLDVDEQEDSPSSGLDLAGGLAEEEGVLDLEDILLDMNSEQEQEGEPADSAPGDELVLEMDDSADSEEPFDLELTLEDEDDK